MKKQLFLSLFTLISMLSQAQTKISGITFPDTLKAGTEKLVMNGGGTREKFWIDMYVGALYLTQKSQDAEKIISSTSAMAIRIHIISGVITSQRMQDAVDEGFEKSTGGKQAIYKTEIDKFKKAFTDAIVVGDEFDIIYSGLKLSVYKNKTLKAENVGYSFKKAVFGIWLGKEPADNDLKKGMLGVKE